MLDIILVPFLQVLIQAIVIFKFIIVIRILISWLLLFGILNYNSPIIEMIVTSIMKLTEPTLGWIRERLPNTAFDLSPIALIIGLIFLQRVVVRIIISLA